MVRCYGYHNHRNINIKLVRNNNMTTFTFAIDGLKDCIVELEDTILELQEQQKDLLAVRGTIEKIVDQAAADLGDARRRIFSDAEDKVIDLIDAVGLPEANGSMIHRMWEHILNESQEY